VLENTYNKLHSKSKKFLNIHGINNKTIKFIPLIKVGLVKNYKYLEHIDKEEIEEFIEESCNSKIDNVDLRASDYPLLYFVSQMQNLKTYNYLGYTFSWKLYELSEDKRYSTKNKLNTYRRAISYIFKLIENELSKYEKILEEKFNKYSLNYNDLSFLLSKINKNNSKTTNGKSNLDNFKTFIHEKFKVSKESDKTVYTKIQYDTKFKDGKKTVENVYLTDNDDENYVELINASSDLNLKITTQKDKAVNKNRVYFPSRNETISLNELLFLHKLPKNILKNNKEKYKTHIFPIVCLIMSCHTGISYQVWYEIIRGGESCIKISKDFAKYSYKSLNEQNIEIILPHYLQRILEYLNKNKSSLIDGAILLNTFFDNVRDNKYGSLIPEVNRVDVINGTKVDNFFKYYYVGSLNLNPIYANYISCSLTNYSDSPMHYTNLDLKKVNDEYLDKYHSMMKKIGLEQNDKVEVSIESTKIGSKKVVELGKIEIIFKGLSNAYEKNRTDDIFSFNLRNFYVLLLVQLVTGLRHRNKYDKKTIYILKLNESSYAVNICDKKQNKQLVYRTIPLIPEISNIILTNENLNNSFIDSIGLKGIKNKADTNFVMFIKENNKIIENMKYTKKLFKDFLYVALGSEDEIKNIETNFMRHFLRTYLFEKLDFNIINEIAGHSNIINSNEYESVLSLEQFKDAIFEYQEKMLMECAIVYNFDF